MSKQNIIVHKILQIHNIYIQKQVYFIFWFSVTLLYNIYKQWNILSEASIQLHITKSAKYLDMNYLFLYLYIYIQLIL